MDEIEISSLDTDLSDATDENVDGCMKEEHKERLRKQLDKHIREIIIEHVYPSMYSKGAITEPQFREIQDLCEAGKKLDATTKFLRYLPTRGFTAFFTFCECLIFTGTPWLSHTLLTDDEEWETLNRLRRERHEKENIIDEYFKIPKKVTEEHLRQLEGGLNRQDAFDVNKQEFLSQTVPKQAAPRPIVAHPTSETASTSIQEITPNQVEQEYNVDETVPKSVDEMETDGHTAKEAGSVKSDGSSEEDSGLDWLKTIRKYQLELAEPGIRGLNYIINAPTGSGKTRTAIYIIHDHLQKMGKSARVIFFCPKRDLVVQQFEKLKKRLPNNDVDFLIGEEVHRKCRIEEMVRRESIVVVTPAIVNNALENTTLLEEDRLKLEDFTLMVFDECHHTDGGHPYNKIMSKYIDIKIKDPEKYKKLPQVIGMTASLGVGQVRAGNEAVLCVVHKCANMDASEIKTVVENTRELEKYSAQPFEETVSLSERPDDPFQKEILSSMTKIENKVKETLANAGGNVKSLLEFSERKHTQLYRAGLSEIKQRLDDIPDRSTSTRLVVLPCLEYLMAFYWTLNTHREARPKDAVVILQRKVQSRPRGKVVEKAKPEIEIWLETIYKETLAYLKSLTEDRSLVNPRLEKMKEYLLEYYSKYPYSYCILFTETRLSTEALKCWINEDPDLKKFNADRITGFTSEENYGVTNKKQESVLQSFKDGKHRILVATSVAEEGLDIQACNLVIRYNYSTNEVGRVQTKGRARKDGSRIANLISEDHGKDVKGKEELNLFREGLMQNAVKILQKWTRETFMKRIVEFQYSDAKDRYFKLLLKEEQKKSKSSDRLLMVCFGCDTPRCFSDEIVTFDNGQKHMCINPDFDSLIRIELHKKAGTHIDEFCKGHKVFCRNTDCRYDMGVVFTYKKVSFPTLKAQAFRLFSLKPNGERGTAFGRSKTWEKTPCNYREITKDELLEKFSGKAYQPDSV